MEKLNIAEILKDCPKGMELDSTIVDRLYFGEVTEHNMIKCYTKQYRGTTCTCNTIYFHHDGTYLTNQNAKCVIFPKGKTTWEGFQIPFKDGDILATDLGSVFYLNTRLNTDECYGCYVGIGGDGSFHVCEPFAYKECCGLATEEEKQKLFDAIKANGYKWNAETKTLEKLIEPKFKVGDRVKHIPSCTSGIVVKVNDKGYYINYSKSVGVSYISFTLEKDYELLPNKFDITTLKPFDRVLVRDSNTLSWTNSFYSNYNVKDDYPFYCMDYGKFKQCIPYESNKHLLGTTNECDEYYKTWK